MALNLTVFGVVVTDMARSLAFYRRLGLDIPAEADTLPHVEVKVGGEVSLLIDTVAVMTSFDPGWSGSKSSLGFACDSPAEVDDTWAEMVKAGYDGHLAPFDAEWGQRYAVLHDPDGNAVDLFSPLSQ